MDIKDNVFKASSVELATKMGLEQMNLSAEEADVEVLSSGGIFSKAQVRITAKEGMEEETKAEIVEESSDMEEDFQVIPQENAAEKAYVKYERRERVDSEEKKAGKAFLEGLIALMPVQARVDAKQFKDELCFYIGGNDASFFIGHRGETLDSIQYLVSQYVNRDKASQELLRVTVDADFYRERRKKTLTALANKLAKNAYANKKEIALEPMNSYERRIIHFALQNSEECTTRSEGEGKDRHVIIVPNCEIISYGTANDFRKKGPAKTKSYGYNKRKF